MVATIFSLSSFIFIPLYTIRYSSVIQKDDYYIIGIISKKVGVFNVRQFKDMLIFE